MRCVVIYESMYGNTHTIAECIADGLRDAGEVEVLPVRKADPERIAAADLVVVGGPTHVHGLSSHLSRSAAVSDDTLEAEAEKGHDLEVDPDAEGPGLRDWFDDLHVDRPTSAAAFDTRMEGNPRVTGRASKGIRRRLKRHGFRTLEVESFLVDHDTRLLDGEEERATRWGRALLAAVADQPSDLPTS